MESIKPTTEELKHYMGRPEFIRNVSILAHVDHGKTTLCDALLATNRLVSKRLAGTVRYLDDRPDEQERGITMKSSAVSLLNVVRGDNGKPTPILLNLIDTPGHIDFSTEVGAALRVCDGAFILVDLAEGVCVQTRECIKKAMQEKCQMILILNKFDRLIVEMKLDVFEIFNYVIRAIELCNVVVAETYQVEYPDTQVDVEDSGFLFSPDTGNVIFASAIHGWGFTLRQLAQLCLTLVVDETVDSLTAKLWDFDCYVDQKKVVKTGAILKGRDNLFKQFCIRTIMAIYEIIVVRMDRSKIPNVLQKLGIANASKDMTHNDPKIQIKAIMQAWRPIAETILLQSLKIFPNPCQLSEEKVDYLLGNAPQTVKKLLSSGNSATIAYVSKMFCVEQGVKSKVVMPTPRGEILEKRMSEVTLTPEPQIEVIALARVFTGCLEIGQELFVLHNKGKHEKVKIKNLYMLFGKDLMSVEKVQPGNFCGISGLENNVLRTATLSSTEEMTPFYESPTLEPVIRNSIEPQNPKDLPILRQGLKLLTQSDSCVQVIMQENGEIVLLTAGDVHLAKCIEDLTKKFAKIEVHVSSPMVALRETILKLEDEDITNPNNHLNIENEHFKLCVVATQIPDFIHNKITKNLPINHEIWSKIWTNKSTNLLINLSEKPKFIDKCIVNAFNTVVKSGPICEEPLMNVAFIIMEFTPLQDFKAEDFTPQLASNIEGLVKQTFRKAFEKREQRLMEPLFTTDIQVEYPDTHVDVEDSGFLFSPDTGNVIFASAIHGWGFTLRQLAQLCLTLVVDETVDSLTAKLWDFDCYVDQKKVVKTGAILKGRDNLFKQFCIRTIMAIYEIIVVRMDRSKIPNVLQKLGITNASKDMTHNDPKIQIKAIMQAWRPIAETILLQSLKIFPNPCQLSEEKVDYLLGNAPQTIKKLLLSGNSATIAYVSKMFCVEQGVKSKVVVPTPRGEILEKRMSEVTLTPEPQIEVIALARVFTGCLEIGQELFVLHNKRKHEKVQIKNLYMLFGKDLMSVEKVQPGNFCGISGLENNVLRTATLSSTEEMTPFYESPTLEPVIRNSIEPQNPKDLPILRQGLKLLTQSDSCVQVIMQENGEIVLLTAGDVHLAKCIEDLTKKFAKIEVHVSSPMVALRETILKLEDEDITNPNNHLNIENEHFKLSVVATQIPDNIHNKITKKLPIDHKIWSKIWTNKSTNLLINLSEKPKFIDKCIVNAFNTVVKSGPICEEPLMNVAFIIMEFTSVQDFKAEDFTPQLASNIEGLVKQTFRKAFEKREQRLMEPLFTTDIQVNTNILGKVYSVVSKRYGKVLDAVGMDEEEKVYLVKAQIPVIESTGFANEIRTTTSGQANPNLKFSHYEIIDGDPFYVPVEEEDDEENHENAIRASKIRRELRLRKGLYVEDQVVIHAEKQRTLNKKK